MQLEIHPAHVEAAMSRMGNASCPGGTRVHACWWPAEATAGPICRPVPGGLQGAKTFTIQVGQRQEIVLVDRLDYTGLGPVSPAEAASRGRPPRIPAAPSVPPAQTPAPS